MSRELSELELNTLKTIGKNVKFVRRGLFGLTLEDMAKGTGVSRDVICRLEAMANEVDPSKSYPSIQTVIKFCDSVGVSPAELFEYSFEDNMNIRNRILEYCSGDLSNFNTIKDSKVVSLDE